jgi:hypothetical protein
MPSPAVTARAIVPQAAARPRCAHCGAPLVEASAAYPRPGRELVCLAGQSIPPPGVTLLPCGAPRWEDRAA